MPNFVRDQCGKPDVFYSTEVSNLYIIIDYNKIGSLDFLKNTAPLDKFFNQLKNSGFKTYEVKNGNSFKQLHKLFLKIKFNKSKNPKVILLNTTKGLELFLKMTQSGIIKKISEQDYEYAEKNLKNNYPQKIWEIRYFSLLNKAKKNKNIYIVSVDYGSPVLDEFRKELPKQFINAGISEQNAVSVATGLSSEGKIVYLYSILTFIVCRSLEQLRLDVCYNNFPINIIVVGPGFIWQAGPTHHSLEMFQL